MHPRLEGVVDILKLIRDSPIYLGYLIAALFNASKRRLKSKKSLEGEKILITGVSMGIGQEVAVQLASSYKNLTLILWDIDEAGLIETTQRCSQLGATVHPYRIDLSKREEVVKISQKVREEVGVVTILINNAGIAVDCPFLNANPDVEEKVMRVNFFSNLWTIREFLPDMIKCGKGQVVSVASGLAFYRWKNLSSYVASKYAVRGFLENLKLELGQLPKKPNITVTAVYPAWVKTPLAATYFNWKPRYNFGFIKPMEPSYVAQKIINGICRNDEEIFIPKSIRLTEIFYRLLPVEFFEKAEKLIYFRESNDENGTDIK